MIEIKNAIIQAASLSTGERGFLDCSLTLDYGFSCQGFGGYVLYLPKSYTHHKLESVAGHFIFRVMEVAGVSDWKEVIGKPVRVKCEFSRVHAIGHIIKDDWFSPSDDFKSLNKDPQ